MNGQVRVRVNVNGETRESEVEPRLLLVHYLRDVLGLTGTHVGCDTSNCGACTVHLNGESVKSCTVLAVQADGAEVRTIEGMSHNGRVYAVITRGYIGAAFYFPDIIDPATKTPVVADVRARKSGSRLTLTPVSGGNARLTFMPGGRR